MDKWLFIFLILTLFSKLSAQTNEQSKSCDLTYSAILAENNLNKTEWINKWLVTYNNSPAEKWTSSYSAERPLSYFLIEHPNFHAAERTSLLVSRTSIGYYYLESVQADWHSAEDVATRTHRQKIDKAEFDRIILQSSKWKQREVLTPAKPIDGFNPEMWGMMTVFSDGQCHQILLGLDDFFTCKTDDCKAPYNLGRVMDVLSPILKNIDYK